MLLQVHYSKNQHLLIQPLLSNTDLNISFIVFQGSFEDDKSKILMIYFGIGHIEVFEKL